MTSARLDPMPMPSFVCPAKPSVDDPFVPESKQNTCPTNPSLDGKTERFRYINIPSCFLSGSPSSVTTCSIVMPERTGPMETPGSITLDALDVKTPCVGLFEQPAKSEVNNIAIISGVG